MTDLLQIALEAHGGLDRWNKFQAIHADVSLDGAIWHFKGLPGLMSKVTLEASTHEQLLINHSFGNSDRRSTFRPEQVTIAQPDGTVLINIDQPRALFSTHTQETQWEEWHAVYFSSYALWNYLNAPFFYTWPDFVTEEIASRQENGETWRGLKITFPDNFATHSKQQVSWFGPDGLLRRHDYTVDVLGGATGANYALDYKEIDGIKVATQRRIYPLDQDGQKIPEPLLVSIDINSISFK